VTNIDITDSEKNGITNNGDVLQGSETPVFITNALSLLHLAVLYGHLEYELRFCFYVVKWNTA